MADIAVCSRAEFQINTRWIVKGPHNHNVLVIALDRHEVLNSSPAPSESNDGHNIIDEHIVAYAVDDACYHMGGALHTAGDIEDLGGHPCIICPVHSYIIALDTGECFYRGLQPLASSGGGPPQMVPTFKSKGKKQRTHRVRLERDLIICTVTTANGGNQMHAKQSTDDQEQQPAEKWASDEYAKSPVCNQRPAGIVRTQHGYRRNGSGLGSPSALHSSLGAIDSRRSGAMLTNLGTGGWRPEMPGSSGSGRTGFFSWR